MTILCLLGYTERKPDTKTDVRLFSRKDGFDMKRNITPLLFGLCLIAVGFGYLGTLLFHWEFNLFFDGWWTLFLIIPGVAGLLSNGPQTLNISLLLVGSLLLLREQEVLTSHDSWVIVVSVLILIAGISLLVGFFRKPKAAPQGWYQPPYTSAYTANSAGPAGAPAYGAGQKAAYAHPFDHRDYPKYTAVLTGINARCDAQDLAGLEATAVLGGIDLDLRTAVIQRDITITLTAVLGGIDVFLPQNIRIQLIRNDVLGGTDCKAAVLGPESGAPMVTLVCRSCLGGIEIK